MFRSLEPDRPLLLPAKAAPRRLTLSPLTSESVCMVLVLAAHLLALWRGQWFDFVTEGDVRWVPLFVSILPVFAAYCLSRLIVRPLTAATFVTSLLLLLTIANRVRLTANTEPLVWQDLVAFENVSVIPAYLKPIHLALFAALALAWLLTLSVGRRWFRKGLSWRVRVVLATLTCLMASWPHLESRELAGSELLRGWLQSKGVMFFSWDLARNASQFGVPFHLMQTSVSASVPEATLGARLAFERLRQPTGPAPTSPRRVVLILCESCWHDEAHFGSRFAGLRAEGFRAFRAVSPVYGGLTVNASFELLTGLPSRGPLRGVIYREYRDRLAGDMHALPNYFAQAGYRTVKMHNHVRQFWSRDRIFSKLGFEDFVSLENMPGDFPEGVWVKDKVLFEAATNLLAQHPQDRHFAFLTTVYTHGAYQAGNDNGATDYATRLGETLDEVVEFVRQLRRSEPDSLVLLIGDHKPQLNHYFLKHGVFDRSHFAQTGPREIDMVVRRDVDIEHVGDVPAYVLHPDAQRVDRFVRAASDRPFFCVAAALDEVFLGGQMPSTRFAAQEGLCDHARQRGYMATVKAYPDWLFALSVLKQEPWIALAAP
jgi:hypothetical protein